MRGLELGCILQLLVAASVLHQVTGVREGANIEVEAVLKSAEQNGDSSEKGRQPLNNYYDGVPKMGSPDIFPKQDECMIVQRGDTWDFEIPKQSGEWIARSLFFTAMGNVFEDDHLDWLSRIGPNNFRLIVPPTAAVGEYVLQLDDGMTIGFVDMKSACLIVLFNAACSECEEFVSEPHGQQENVAETKGLIWRGAALSNAGYYWEYDQFRFVNLRVAIDLLGGLTEDEGLTELQHASGVEVARELSYTINEHVCTGKWDGAYTEGTTYDCKKAWPEQCNKPSHWSSSTDIIEQHWALRQKEGNNEFAVQYCQCWVFAGLMTTLGRALGLPTRPVTNFESAHDSNNDRAISKFYWKDPEGLIAGLRANDACPDWCEVGIERGDPDRECDFSNETCHEEIRRGLSFSDNCRGCARCIPCASGGDSKWNFHVWNEVFLKRQDVLTAEGATESASGWQAVDATPQEESHGRMQMGPAPLTLVNEAAEACYETKFVAAEVNADFKVYVLTGITQESEAYEGKGFFEMTDGSNLYLNRRWVNEPFGGSGTSRKKGVGAKVLTKKPGRLPLDCQKPGPCQNPLWTWDVTWMYKSPGSLIGVDPPDYTPLLCPRLDEDDGSDIDEEDIMEDESLEVTSLHHQQPEYTKEVNAVVKPVVEQPIEYPTSPTGSNPSFAQVTDVRGKAGAGYIVEAQRMTDLGYIYGGDVRMDSAFLIRDVSRTWTQQELMERDPLLGVSPGEATVLEVKFQSLNMHEARHITMSITAMPVDYRGRPFPFKTLRNRKIFASVQFTQSGATRIKKSGSLNPGSGVQTFSHNLEAGVFSAMHLQAIGVDIGNCAAFDFVVSATVTNNMRQVTQMLVTEHRVYWGPP